jgi:hypothetical protein
VSTEIFHVPLVALVFRGHMFDVDHATVLCTDRTIAERLAELVPSNADGIEDAEVERLNDECEALRCENAQLRGDLAAAYCRMDDMEGLNDE